MPLSMATIGFRTGGPQLKIQVYAINNGAYMAYASIFV